MRLSSSLSKRLSASLSRRLPAGLAAGPGGGLAAGVCSRLSRVRGAGCAAVLAGLLLAGCPPLPREIDGSRPSNPSVAGDESFVRPVPGLTAAQIAQFKRGRSLFDKVFTPAEGLGPTFNNTSCKACHGFPNSGGGSAEVLTLIAGVDNEAPRTLREKGGPVVTDRSVLGIPLEYFPPETRAISKRISPVSYGVGLIEAIPAADITAQLEYDARRAELGIRGRANVDGDKIGRLGWKAQTGDMRSFTVTAANFEMGLSSKERPHEFFPNLPPQLIATDSPPAHYGTDTLCFTLEPFKPAVKVESLDACPPASGSAVSNYVTRYFKEVKGGRFPVEPDLSPEQVDDLTAFQRFQAAPPPLPLTGQAQEGKRHFDRVGCAGCHAPEFRTGKNGLGIPAGLAVPLYSDLLLHDLGPEMSDGIIYQGVAAGSAWRTAPLWGLRYRRRFIHDGRTDSIEEAIQAHGGEGARTVANYDALSPFERDALKAFLLSI